MSAVADLAFADALTQVNTLVNDPDNFTFTVAQKTAALTTAWLDPWAVNHVWDSTTTFVDGTWSYPVPTTISVVQDIYITRSSADFPEPLDTTLYEIVAGNIQFNPHARTVLSGGYTLYVKGTYKIGTTDNLVGYAKQSYVINVAAQVLLRQISFMKVLRFLRNDTSLADIANLRHQVDIDVATFRQALARSFEGS